MQHPPEIFYIQLTCILYLQYTLGLVEGCWLCILNVVKCYFSASHTFILSFISVYLFYLSLNICRYDIMAVKWCECDLTASASYPKLTANASLLFICFHYLGKLSKKKTTKHMENSISQGGGPGASFSICYNETFKMHKKPF